MIFQHVAPKIAAKGYRVLLYDLYGRGYSDAPQTTYDSTLYATQLALLMQHVGWDRAGVVGVSMVSPFRVASDVVGTTRLCYANSTESCNRAPR